VSSAAASASAEKTAQTAAPAATVKNALVVK
jgi:hypothetical protein